MDDSEQLRQGLPDRVHDCWKRLDDVVDELIAVHEVPLQEIVAAVERLAEDECGSGEAAERSA